MLLLLLVGVLSLNLGSLTLGVLNTRSVRNKGPLLADIVASNDLDILCLTETHVRPSIQIVAYFLKDLILHVSVAVLVFFIKLSTTYIKWSLLSMSHLRTWWCLLGFTAIHCCLPVSIAL